MLSVAVPSGWLLSFLLLESSRESWTEWIMGVFPGPCGWKVCMCREEAVT